MRTPSEPRRDEASFTLHVFFASASQTGMQSPVTCTSSQCSSHSVLHRPQRENPGAISMSNRRSNVRVQCAVQMSGSDNWQHNCAMETMKERRDQYSLSRDVPNPIAGALWLSRVWRELGSHRIRTRVHTTCECGTSLFHTCAGRTLWCLAVS